MDTIVGLKLKSMYKLFVFEGEVNFYVTDDYVFIDHKKDFYHLKVDDNKLIVNKVEKIKDINLVWEAEVSYSLGLKTIVEEDFLEISHEKKYFQNNTYNYLIEYFSVDGNLVFGFVLGFDEFQILYNKDELDKVKKLYNK